MMKRARGVLAVAGFAVTLGARVGAQAVTLPTIRTSKTPEMELLTQTVKAMQEAANQPSRLRTADDSLWFKCQLGQIALTPFTKRELTRARGFGDSVVTATQLAADRLFPGKSVRDTAVERRVKNAGFVRSIKNEIPARPSVTMPDGLADVLDRIPVGCPNLPELTQDGVHQIVEPYREAEADNTKRARLDSLEQVASANVVQRELRERRIRPIRSHDDAVEFWQQPSGSTLNIGAISGGNNEGATYTELGSRILHAFRFSFSAVIASGKDSTSSKPGDATKEDSSANGATISRFLNGGGLLNVGVAYPLAHLGTSTGSADFLGIFAPRFGGTLPVLGASGRDTTLVYDLGTEFMFKSLDKLGGLGLYFQTRLGYAGGSPTFMRLIGDGENRHTGYQTVTAGFTVDDRFIISMSKTVSGPRSLQQTGWQVGVSLARGASSPAGGTQ
jgi:hypothetical protein